jgi:hypothetical protein
VLAALAVFGLVNVAAIMAAAWFKRGRRTR